MKKNKAIYSLMGVLVLVTSLYIVGCGGGSSSSSSGGSSSNSSLATLTGTVNTFTAALETEKKTMFAQIKDFIFSKAYAVERDIVVSVGEQSATTDSDGRFTINNVPTGDQTVTFTRDSVSATYSLKDVDAGETFTLDEISVSAGTVTTAHTGSWTGTLFNNTTGMNDIIVMTIQANGNTLSGSGTSIHPDSGFEAQFTFEGTENGSTADGSYNVNTACPGESGTFAITFSGSNTGTLVFTIVTSNQELCPTPDGISGTLSPGTYQLTGS